MEAYPAGAAPKGLYNRLDRSVGPDGPGYWQENPLKHETATITEGAHPEIIDGGHGLRFEDAVPALAGLLELRGSYWTGNTALEKLANLRPLEAHDSADVYAAPEPISQDRQGLLAA